MEEEKSNPDIKNYSREYETILRKESIKPSFDKFELYFDEEEGNQVHRKLSRMSLSKKVGEVANPEEDDYAKLKSGNMIPLEDNIRKGRTSSILRLLENNIEERKISICDN
jgi:hypothetical protein